MSRIRGSCSEKGDVSPRLSRDASSRPMALARPSLVMAPPASFPPPRPKLAGTSALLARFPTALSAAQRPLKPSKERPCPRNSIPRSRPALPHRRSRRPPRPSLWPRPRSLPRPLFPRDLFRSDIAHSRLGRSRPEVPFPLPFCGRGLVRGSDASPRTSRCLVRGGGLPSRSPYLSPAASYATTSSTAVHDNIFAEAMTAAAVLRAFIPYLRHGLVRDGAPHVRPRGLIPSQPCSRSLPRPSRGVFAAAALHSSPPPDGLIRGTAPHGRQRGLAREGEDLQGRPAASSVAAPAPSLPPPRPRPR